MQLYAITVLTQSLLCGSSVVTIRVIASLRISKSAGYKCGSPILSIGDKYSEKDLGTTLSSKEP